MVSITDIVERFDILREQQQSSNKIITVSERKEPFGLAVSIGTVSIRTGSDMANIQDLLNYVANVEKTLRDEVAHLSEQLTNTRLDLEDSIKSRRELQQKLLHAEQLLQQADARYNFLYSETEFLKVGLSGLLLLRWS